MNQEAIKLWLKRRKSSGATVRCLTAFAALLGGLLILFLTFWFIYEVIWICFPCVSTVSELVFSKKLRLAHEWRLILSGVFLLFLFVLHFRTNPWYWGNYPREDFGRAWRLGHTLGPVAALLSTPSTSANIIGDILLCGPRLTIGSCKLWRESRRIGAVDEEGCAQLLSFLASCSGAVPYEELRAAGWEEWFGQLRCVDGVIFLEKGISLSSELRQELQQLSAS